MNHPEPGVRITAAPVPEPRPQVPDPNFMSKNTLRRHCAVVCRSRRPLRRPPPQPPRHFPPSATKSQHQIYIPFEIVAPGNFCPVFTFRIFPEVRNRRRLGSSWRTAMTPNGSTAAASPTQLRSGCRCASVCRCRRRRADGKPSAELRFQFPGGGVHAGGCQKTERQLPDLVSNPTQPGRLSAMENRGFKESSAASEIQN